jgi:hypothetical protein
MDMSTGVASRVSSLYVVDCSTKLQTVEPSLELDWALYKAHSTSMHTHLVTSLALPKPSLKGSERPAYKYNPPNQEMKSMTKGQRVQS